jgi:hypothetical protein
MKIAAATVSNFQKGRLIARRSNILPSTAGTARTKAAQFHTPSQL